MLGRRPRLGRDEERRVTPAVRGLAPRGHVEARRRTSDPGSSCVKVVLDANILISVLVFPGGAPEFASRAAIQRRLLPSPASASEVADMVPSVLLLRPMRAAPVGLPRRGRSSSRLGVRTTGPIVDIEVWSGRVWPHTGGLSVTMDDAGLLPPTSFRDRWAGRACTRCSVSM